MKVSKHNEKYTGAILIHFTISTCSRKQQYIVALFCIFKINVVENLLHTFSISATSVAVGMLELGKYFLQFLFPKCL